MGCQAGDRATGLLEQKRGPQAACVAAQEPLNGRWSVAANPAPAGLRCRRCTIGGSRNVVNPHRLYAGLRCPREVPRGEHIMRAAPADLALDRSLRAGGLLAARRLTLLLRQAESRDRVAVRATGVREEPEHLGTGTAWARPAHRFQPPTHPERRLLPSRTGASVRSPEPFVSPGPARAVSTSSGSRLRTAGPSTWRPTMQ